MGLREAWEAEQGWRARPTAEAARGARGGALALTRCGALHGRGAEEEAEARGARGGGGAGRGGQACRGAEPRKAQHPRHPPLREEPEGADPPGRGDPDWGPGSRGRGGPRGPALGSDLWPPSAISCGAALPVPRFAGRDWDRLKAFLGLLSLENPGVGFAWSFENTVLIAKYEGRARCTRARSCTWV